jgi:hypothetical protein
MLNCLRYTDLSQIAGLLYPMEVVIAGDFPPSYSWAEDLHRTVTPAGRFHKLTSMIDWSPSS